MRWSGPCAPTPESDREHALRRLAERDRDDARAFGHALAGAQVERHAGPTPVVDLAAQRDERLGLGVRAHAGLVEVAVVLAAHDLRRLDRAQRTEHLVLLFADRSRLERGRRFHRHEREHLEQVVHDHVAVRAGLLVEADALTDRQRLGHVDLHVRDVLAVPDRLEQSVREPEREDVERRFLAEEVVDAEDLALVERRRAACRSACTALARSVPNGFSMMMRARSASPTSPSSRTTSGAAAGGTLR